MRKKPIAALLILLTALGAGWAIYKYSQQEKEAQIFNEDGTVKDDLLKDTLKRRSHPQT